MARVVRELSWVLLLWLPTIAPAQAPDFAPLKNSWPTYSGDYSGQRFSSLTQIDTSNVKNMTLAWTARLSGGPSPDWGGGLGPVHPPTIVGGEGIFRFAAPTRVRGAILESDGICTKFNGKPRKLVLQATRNGLFFVLDRVTGEHLRTTRFAQWGKWIREFNQSGQPVRDPAKDASRAGTLVNPNGWTNWPPSAYSPQTGLFYLRDMEAYGLMYYTEKDPAGAKGLGGIATGGTVPLGSVLQAVDYRTGKAVWERSFGPGGAGTGMLTTAGGLLFTSDAGDNFVAFDARTGVPLWHSRLHRVTTAAESYALDDHQYVLIAAGDMLYAFCLYE